MRIAVIDNYISCGFVKEMTGTAIETYQISEGCCRPCQEDRRSFSHGSICAALMVEFTPGAEHIGISAAPNGQEDFSIANICMALEWCSKNQIPFICMSIGTVNWLGARPMQSVTKKLSDSGSTMICAVSPDKKLTFPACYPWTIAVHYKEECEHVMRSRTSCLGYDVVAGHFHSEVLDRLSRYNKFFLKRSSSMAVPFVLGQLIQNNDISRFAYEYPHERTHSFDFLQYETPIVRVVHQNVYKIRELNSLLQSHDYMSALLTNRLSTDWSGLDVCVNDADEVVTALSTLQEANLILLDANGFPNGIGNIWDLEIDLDTGSLWESYLQIHNFFCG